MACCLDLPGGGWNGGAFGHGALSQSRELEHFIAFHETTIYFPTIYRQNRAKIAASSLDALPWIS
jgi:hypothetical protein